MGGRFSVSASSYKVLRPLDHTDNSSVHLAVWETSRSQIAVKRVCKQTSRQPVRMHVNEVRTLARLRHPCIVQLLGVVDTPTKLDLLLEYCPGGCLTSHVRENSGPSHEQELLQLMCDLTSALAYMHDECFVHLDVKPDNLLVSSSYRGRLCDFGTATRVDASCLLGGLVGTPGYRAPEVEQGLQYD